MNHFSIFWKMAKLIEKPFIDPVSGTSSAATSVWSWPSASLTRARTLMRPLCSSRCLPPWATSRPKWCQPRTRPPARPSCQTSSALPRPSTTDSSWSATWATRCLATARWAIWPLIFLKFYNLFFLPICTNFNHILHCILPLVNSRMLSIWSQFENKQRY